MEAQPPKTNILKEVLLPSVIIIAIILSGIGTGWKLAHGKSLNNTTSISETGNTKAEKGKEVGSTDTKTFKDEAEGTIEEGGVNGEGTHKLLREGGASQTAALTSSGLDLYEFLGKKVQIWGETFNSPKAAWLMNVGKIKVVEYLPTAHATETSLAA